MEGNIFSCVGHFVCRLMGSAYHGAVETYLTMQWDRPASPGSNTSPSSEELVGNAVPGRRQVPSRPAYPLTDCPGPSSSLPTPDDVEHGYCLAFLFSGTMAKFSLHYLLQPYFITSVSLFHSRTEQKRVEPC